MATKSLQSSSCFSTVSPWVTSLLYPFGSRVILPMCFESIRVSGLQYLPASGPLLIAPTHRSRWDGVVIGHCLGRPASGRDPRYMVSINEMSGVQGWLIRKFGGFAVDPDTPAIATLRHGVELLLCEQPLVIFGEGDIFLDRTVKYIKPGLARIALQAQNKAPRSHTKAVKILPVGLYYSDPTAIKSNSVEVRLGPTLDVSGYLDAQSKQAATRLTMDLKNSLNDLMLQESASTLVPA